MKIALAGRLFLWWVQVDSLGETKSKLFHLNFIVLFVCSEPVLQDVHIGPGIVFAIKVQRDTYLHLLCFFDLIACRLDLPQPCPATKSSRKVQNIL